MGAGAGVPCGGEGESFRHRAAAARVPVGDAAVRCRPLRLIGVGAEEHVGDVGGLGHPPPGPVLVPCPVPQGGRSGDGHEVCGDVHPCRASLDAECFGLWRDLLLPARVARQGKPRGSLGVAGGDQIQGVGDSGHVVGVVSGDSFREVCPGRGEPGPPGRRGCRALGQDRGVDVAPDELLRVLVCLWLRAVPGRADIVVVGDLPENLVEPDPLVLLADPLDGVVMAPASSAVDCLEPFGCPAQVEDPVEYRALGIVKQRL